MDRDRKTEIVTETISKVLNDLQEEYGEEIEFSLDADYLSGKIVIRVNA